MVKSLEGNETELIWDKLSKEQKKLPIANLNNKENRDMSGANFSKHWKSIFS